MYKKKLIKRITNFLAVTLTLAIVLTMMPIKANAATNLQLNGLSSSGIYVMEKGSHKQLKANKNVKWKSNNKKVVYCSSRGWIKALKKGKTYITIKAKDGSGQYKRVKVIVGTKVKKVKISGESTVLKYKNINLKSTASPSNASYKSVTWKSSNKNIATVSSKGVVTGKKGGTVTITATSKDGNKKYARKKVKVVTLKSTDVNFIAHRGVSAFAPENTADAFKLAGQYKFYGAECDIWPTKPDENGQFKFVVSHDNSLSRMCNYNKNITDMTWEEIDEAKNNGLKVVNGHGISKYGAQELLYIEDYLKIMKQYNLTPIIEVKSDTTNIKESNMEIAETLCKTVNDFDLLNESSIISFSFDKLKSIQASAREKYGLAPNIMYLGNNKIVGKDAINKAAENEFTGVSFAYSVWNSSLVSYARSKGMIVAAWTTDNSKVAYNLKTNYDVDQISTNSYIFD